MAACFEFLDRPALAPDIKQRIAALLAATAAISITNCARLTFKNRTALAPGVEHPHRSTV